MKYRVHLTAGSNGLPFSDTRQRAGAALDLCERLALNAMSYHGDRRKDGSITPAGWDLLHKVRDLDPSRGGEVMVYGRLLILTPSRS